MGSRSENSPIFEPLLAKAVAQRIYGHLPEHEIRTGFGEHRRFDSAPMSSATLIEVRASLIQAGTHLVEACRRNKRLGFQDSYVGTEIYLETHYKNAPKVHDGHHIVTAWELRHTTTPSFWEAEEPQGKDEWKRINDNEEGCTLAWQGQYAENRLNPLHPVPYVRRTADDFVSVIKSIPGIEQLYSEIV